MLKSLRKFKSTIVKHNRKWLTTRCDDHHHETQETFRDRVRRVNDDIEQYMDRYYSDHGIRIYLNHDHDHQLEITCPTCRKKLRISKRRRTVYVRTECVRCLKEVTKTVVLSCRHANICRNCYENLIEHRRDVPPYFVYGNGDPVDITNEQVHLYVRKKKCYSDW